ncbi:MAG: 50S ribosomal protein L21 [Candidatus Omnitrophica bacterium]|nr:50S ribosomal protein L21 [Candidatus Omnitrophota bacterium]MBU2044354.1 50S ribosomal protein L21 [Candidatus Omnitrophota bacterium]MBU2265683.1 50S ribosomal protein L21 [Candidatus Omnitrophota bacterium]MBU2473801.1 50S ribosomal protein L21 [Candidatus Omnitrophota bacterium]
MLAIVEIGTKQYLVKKGDKIKVQRLKEKEGKISFDKVLLLSDDKKTKVGTPYLEKAHVEAQIQGEIKDKKVIIYKSKRRKKYRRKQGHRQIYTNLTITRIASTSS